MRGHYGQLEVIDIDLNARVARFQATSEDGPVGPVSEAPIRMILPLSDEDNKRFWTMLGEKVIDKVRQDGSLPDFYRSLSAALGEDSAGEPAVYFKIFVDSPKGAASDAVVTRWNQFTREFLDQLLRLRLQRQPYVFLGAA